MSQTVLATFDNGVFVPDAPLPLPVHARVRLTIEQVAAKADGDDAAEDELEQLWKEATVNSGGVRPTRDELHERR